MKSNARRKAKKSARPSKADAEGFLRFSLSSSNPLYDRNKKKVRKLAGAAWQVNRVHIFRTELSAVPRFSAEDEKEMTLAEFFQSVPAKTLWETSDIETQEAKWLNDINTKPALRGVTMTHLWWIMTGQRGALKEFAKAFELYDKELSGWNAHNLTCLCVLIACDAFELSDPDMTRVTAEMLWEKALEIYQRIRQQATQPNTERRDISKVNRTKVYKDLGIKLKFPPGLKKINAVRHRTE